MQNYSPETLIYLLQILAYKILVKCSFLNFFLHQNPRFFFGSSEETPDIERLGATMEKQDLADYLLVILRQQLKQLIKYDTSSV